MMEAIPSSKTPILTRAVRRHIPEDGTLHSHCRENLKGFVQGTQKLNDGYLKTIHPETIEESLHFKHAFPS
jgi:hypothetical protein